MSHRYALILAGGSGTRFWPLSRDRKPKQLLDLFGNGTLLKQTLNRLAGLIPPENILILTNHRQEAEVRLAAPELPPENIMAEPAKRDTAPAIALGIGLVAARHPEATMLVLPADQLIRDTASYQSVMRDALSCAEQSTSIVTVGIKPTWPCPSYGYVERGAQASIEGQEFEHPPFMVEKFREKPSTELAAQFLEAGNFVWNAGIFAWSIPTIIRELTQHCPELSQFIVKAQQATDLPALVSTDFPSLTSTSIDYALLEHSKKVLNIEAHFDWDDIGSWISIAKHLPQDDSGNRSNDSISALKSSHNIVFNTTKEKHIALLGVDDLIVVQTEDSILIAHKDQADSIKELSSQLPQNLT